jgi:hypothetical protein
MFVFCAVFAEPALADEVVESRAAAMGGLALPGSSGRIMKCAALSAALLIQL